VSNQFFVAFLAFVYDDAFANVACFGILSMTHPSLLTAMIPFVP